MRKPPRRAWLAVAAVTAVTAALALAACDSSGGSVAGGAGQPPRPSASAISHPASAAAKAAHFKLKATCVPVMAAYDVTDAGTAAWAVPLSSPAVKRYGLVSPGFPPVAIDGLAVFTADNVISALRLTDGSQAWQRTYTGASGSGPDGVGGLWAWHGELIALTSSMEGPGPVRVQALDPATGAVRWTVSLGTGVRPNSTPAMTSAGCSPCSSTPVRGRPGS